MISAEEHARFAAKHPAVTGEDVYKRQVVYNENHELDSFMTHRENPNLVIVDSKVISEAPARMLAAGMGDGISTKFESRACIASDLENYGGGKATKTAETLAQLCYDIIMKNGKAAYKAVQNQVVTKALEEVIEANIYLSGVGAEGTGDAGAHGLHDALTLIPECRKYMHGELVSFGTLVQLVLENESEEQIKEILEFNCAVDLPVCLSDIGLDKTDAETLDKIAPVSYTHLWIPECGGDDHQCAEGRKQIPGNVRDVPAGGTGMPG